MTNEIISYLEMCQREGTSLQRGMNFRLSATHSVLLMSLRPNAPYEDLILDGGTTLVYEGHDEPRSAHIADPKGVDQPHYTKSDALTENGKFYEAACAHKELGVPPERVRVYEKIRQGIWSDNGLFHLVGSWIEHDGRRNVFKFRLVAIEDTEVETDNRVQEKQHRRIIPTVVKLEVWKRDKGQCVLCGSTQNLHFDHIIPFSKGGTSLKAENIQLLCAYHNIQKHDKIE